MSSLRYESSVGGSIRRPSQDAQGEFKTLTDADIEKNENATQKKCHPYAKNILYVVVAFAIVASLAGILAFWAPWEGNNYI